MVFLSSVGGLRNVTPDYLDTSGTPCESSVTPRDLLGWPGTLWAYTRRLWERARLDLPDFPARFARRLLH